MWMRERILRCPDCGTRLDEWDPKKGGDRHAYIPQIFTCPGCAQTGILYEEETKAIRATQGGGAVSGMKVKLVPKHIIQSQVKKRTPAQRAQLAQMEAERVENERTGKATEQRPVKSQSLGGERPPPIKSSKGLVKPPSPPIED